MDETIVTPPVTDESTRIGGANGIAPGRKKGSKNKSTILREALTNNFEAQLEQDFSKVIQVIMHQAIHEGCRQSQKLLIDRVIPTVHAENEKDKKNPFAGGISITISSLENQSVKVSSDVIDADYEELN